MPKYIDAEKIRENAVFPFLNGDKEKQWIYRAGFYHAMQCAERAETEDVQEARHGEWCGSVCSACGSSVYFYYDCDYCPNCGAKMDGGGN